MEALNDGTLYLEGVAKLAAMARVCKAREPTTGPTIE
jgi:hypothetical protein